MSKKPFQKNPVIEETYGSGRSSAHSRGVEPDSGGRNCGCSFPPDIAPWGRGWPELVQGQGSAAGGRGHPARRSRLGRHLFFANLSPGTVCYLHPNEPSVHVSSRQWEYPRE